MVSYPMPSSAPTRSLPAESGIHQTEHSYEGAVRAALLKLGSNDPDGDTSATGEFWRQCMKLGIAPEVTASVIYSTARHRHVGASTLREGASESPTRDEWEVIVRRTGSMEQIIQAAGRKADAVEGNLVIFGDFYDDETARDFARKLTKAGYIVTYGPHKMPAAAESQEGDPSAMEEDLTVFVARVNQAACDSKTGRYGRSKVFISHVWRAFSSEMTLSEFKEKLVRAHRGGLIELSRADLTSAMDPKDVADSEVAYLNARWHFVRAPDSCQGASEVAPVISEPSGRIPYTKVERNPKAHEAAMELAKKHGPIGSPQKVYELLGEDFAKEDSEIFVVIPLNLRGELKAIPYEVARGQRSHVAVGVNDVMRAVLDSGCEGFYCAHSHPSGRCQPSKADRDLTNQIKAAAAPFGREVKYLDHFVVGTRSIYSIEEGKAYKIK